MLNKNNKLRHSISLAAVLALSGLSASAWADAYEDAAKKWIGSEFKPSTLTEAQQLEELKWFIKAAEPFRGMKINVVSETLTTHEYESKVLAKAFSEITGNQADPRPAAGRRRGGEAANPDAIGQEYL